MSQYVVQKDFAADDADAAPAKFAAGEVITEADILPGCLESALRMQYLAPHDGTAEVPVVAIPARRKPGPKPKKKPDEPAAPVVTLDSVRDPDPPTDDFTPAADPK